MKNIICLLLGSHDWSHTKPEECGKAVRVVGKHKKSQTCDLCLDTKPILMVRNR